MAKLLAIVFGLCAVLFMVGALPYEEGEASTSTKDPISGSLTQPTGQPGTEMPSQNGTYTMPPANPPPQPAPPSQNGTYTMPPPQPPTGR